MVNLKVFFIRSPVINWRLSKVYPAFPNLQHLTLNIVLEAILSLHDLIVCSSSELEPMFMVTVPDNNNLEQCFFFNIRLALSSLESYKERYYF